MSRSDDLKYLSCGREGMRSAATKIIMELEKEYNGLTFDYNHLLSFVVAKNLGSEFDKFKVVGVETK